MQNLTRFALVAVILLPAGMRGSGVSSAAAVALVHVPNGGQAVAAQITKDGTIHLLYNSERHPVLREIL